MIIHSINRLLFLASVLSTVVAQAATSPVEVPRCGIFEATLEHRGEYANPYWDLEAMAELTGPDRKTVAVDLFWDGEKTWKFRYSPPMVGAWRWKTVSKDEGLNGQSGEFNCVKSELRGGIRPMKDYPFHFEHEDGTPFWLFGDTLWDMFGADPKLTFTRATFEQYVKLRAGQKFNFVEGILLSPPAGNEGGLLFADPQRRSVNPKFFRESDERMVFLNRHGITAMIFLSWSNGQGYIITWGKFADAESRQKYARYVIARYGAYNVCFGVTGEWEVESKSVSESELDAIGQLLFDHNPHGRMIAIHPIRTSTRRFGDRPWMSFGDYQQNYENLHQEILQSRFANWRKRTPWPPDRCKPVVNGEYALYMRVSNKIGRVDKWNGATVDMIRHATYDIAMAGGYFVTGWGSTYWGGYRNPRAGFAPGDPIDKPWEEQVRHVCDLFTSLAWWKLEPADHLVKIAAESPSTVPTIRNHDSQQFLPTVWCLADPGRQYVVYVRLAKQVTVTLEQTGTPYRLERFDPRTGERFRLADMPDGERQIEVPDTQDHIFIISGTTNGPKPIK